MTSTARGRALAAAAVILAFGAGTAVGTWLSARRVPAGASSTRGTVPASVSPEQCIPLGVRGVLLADVARLRSSPALARFFEADRGADEPCEARLLRGVQRVALAVPGEGFDDFAVAFAGDLPRDQLLACARARQGGGAATLRTGRYRGLDVLRAEPRRDPGLLPAAGSEIVYLPGGTVLTGEPGLVRRMVDRALAGDDAQDTAAGTDALGELRARLGAGYAVESEFLFPGGAQPDADADPAFRHIVGAAVGASFEQGARAVAVLACDDFDAPRAVADALERARTRLRERLDSPALSRALASAAIERRATDVRVTLDVSAADADALFAAAQALLAPPSPRESTAAPPAGDR